MAKKTKTISIDSRLLEWVNQCIEEKKFASLSHAIELALFELKKQYDKKP